jgi:hypothetical protein
MIGIGLVYLPVLHKPRGSRRAREAPATIHLRRKPEMSNKHQQEASTHQIFNIGSLTRRGGRVTRITTRSEYLSLTLTRVGDVVTWEDGMKAIIIDGAGLVAIAENESFALVSSRLSNADTTMETLQPGRGTAVRNGEQVPGLFDSGYGLSLVVATHQGGTRA